MSTYISYIGKADNFIEAKPFLKWAGGKGQLLDDITKRLPDNIKETKSIERYVEPFIGGGAVFFYLKSNYNIKESYLFDVNRELVVAFKVVKQDKEKLINELRNIEKEYINKDKDGRKSYYYTIRDTYNEQMIDFNFDSYNADWITRASYIIFLNRTCFNGLFRQNSKGEFNVPHGRYKNPTICDDKKISEASKALQNTKIYCGDFNESKKYVNKKTLVYMDPPYRPLNKTSSFTGYFKGGFTDEDQKRLADYYKNIDKKGAPLILSNSDPKNEDPDDDFFDSLYEGFNIERVKANRMINCDAANRGEINELIIRNYNNGELD